MTEQEHSCLALFFYGFILLTDSSNDDDDADDGKDERTGAVDLGLSFDTVMW